jgi:hypothetical protein
LLAFSTCGATQVGVLAFKNAANPVFPSALVNAPPV